MQSSRPSRAQQPPRHTLTYPPSRDTHSALSRRLPSLSRSAPPHSAVSRPHVGLTSALSRLYLGSILAPSRLHLGCRAPRRKPTPPPSPRPKPRRAPPRPRSPRRPSRAPKGRDPSPGERRRDPAEIGRDWPRLAEIGRDWPILAERLVEIAGRGPRRLSARVPVAKHVRRDARVDAPYACATRSRLAGRSAASLGAAPRGARGGAEPVGRGTSRRSRAGTSPRPTACTRAAARGACR